MLCSQCESIFEPSRQETRRPTSSGRVGELYRHHGILALATSKQAGCHLCTIIYSVIGPQDRERLFRLAPSHEGQNGRQEGSGYYYLWGTSGLFNIELSYGAGLESVRATVVLSQDTTESIARQHEESQVKRADNITIDLIGAPSSTTDSEESIAFVLENLKICLQTHQLCLNSFYAYQQLPARLLDISAVDSESKIFLRDTSGMTPSTPYTTLSHRWGDLPPLSLMESDLDSMVISGIHLASMPVTFRDATLATQKFGFRCLWIDSLYHPRPA